MAIIGANIPIPERDMSSGIAPAVTAKDNNTLFTCKLAWYWRRHRHICITQYSWQKSNHILYAIHVTFLSLPVTVAYLLLEEWNATII